jgi:hypothetical protein
MFSDLPGPADTLAQTFFDVLVWMSNKMGGHEVLSLLGGSLALALGFFTALSAALLYAAVKLANAEHFQPAVVALFVAQEVLIGASWIVSLSAYDHIAPAQLSLIALPVIFAVVFVSLIVKHMVMKRKKLALAV